MFKVYQVPVLVLKTWNTELSRFGHRKKSIDVNTEPPYCKSPLSKSLKLIFNGRC